ncbi:PREDICTED: probable salivary secreted peptide [Drosophila arizonae]|uniref:Probable salivary secreted peptide n=1 Tax=Drosophila arizonae TaxID=7263 RepID=A0ABM1PFD2_DROAR|nr:PREDICTED: probable salivary secreted peptide [Drosophila arizonae]
MKVVYLALLVSFSLVAVGRAAGKNESHSVTWGSRSFRDMHLERVIISEKSKFLRVVTRTYTFKQTGVQRLITQIVVTDQIKNGNGGYARLEAGGPNTNFAKIYFKSQRNKEFSFIVDIYGI